MKRRELFKQMLAAGVAAATAGSLQAQGPGYNGPAGGTRGTQLVTILAGAFDTSAGPNGVRSLTDIPQFATYVRIQVNPGQQGKIAIGSSTMAAATGNIAGTAFIELWPNWDGSIDNGRSDTWTMSDPKWLNTIDLSKIYVWPEIAGERPVITAYQLV
ncbi:MAG TPA: hypothetical protein VNH83_16520 [Bryobacteraceae bacterium]|jgi:hypothetical protein|nr:hypothetical protein [Bryobacteraceae bacterium]